MKRTAILLTAFSLALTAAPVFAQEDFDTQDEWEAEDYGWDEMADLDNLFESAEDVEGSESSSEQQLAELNSSGGTSAAPKIFSLFGSLTAEAAYSRKLYDFTGDLNYPGAYLSYNFGISMRPSQNLTAKCVANVSFPYYGISISSLYFDYVMFGKLYLTVGKTTTSWGNAAIFDTDILDDTGDPMSVILLTVPLRPGSFEASVNMHSFNESALLQSLYYAAAIEYPFRGFSYKLFARTWPSADGLITASYAGKAALGAEITGDIASFHTTLYGAMHTDSSSWTNIQYGKVVAGIGRYWEEPQKHGFVFEYQLVMDGTAAQVFDHKLAFNSTWRHVADSRYSVSLLGQYHINDATAYIMPALAISGLPHATLGFALPVLFNGATYSTSGDNISYTITGTGFVSAFLTAYISLSFSY